jgi:hypothetical protein
MYALTEFSEVRETEHLVPVLPLVSKCLFGDNSYLTDRPPRQSDWITEEMKVGDGLLWLPWEAELWLVEIEWKKNANLINQVRTFAKSKVDRAKLRCALKGVMGQQRWARFFDQLESGLKEGHIADCIIEKTLRAHIHHDGCFRPHVWVVLGHSGNQEALRSEYLHELKLRIEGQQHFLLTTTRMFRGDYMHFLLLEQHYSQGFPRKSTVPASALVPLPGLPGGGVPDANRTAVAPVVPETEGREVPTAPPTSVLNASDTSVRDAIRMRATGGELDGPSISSTLGMSPGWVSNRACVPIRSGRPSLLPKHDSTGQPLRGLGGRFRFDLQTVLKFIDEMEAWVARTEKLENAIPLVSAEAAKGTLVSTTEVSRLPRAPKNTDTVKKRAGPPKAFCLSATSRGYSLLFCREFALSLWG